MTGSGSKVGGLIGINEIVSGSKLELTHSFWNISVYEDDVPDNGLGTPLTSEQLNDPETYVDWDIDDEWHQPDDHPPIILKLNPIINWVTSLDSHPLGLGDTSTLKITTEHKDGQHFAATSMATFDVLYLPLS